MTNHEWLKSLTVDELAEWLNTLNLAVVPVLCPKKVPKEWEKHGGKCGYGVGWADCDAKCTLMWLQEEHEDA